LGTVPTARFNRTVAATGGLPSIRLHDLGDAGADRWRPAARRRREVGPLRPGDHAEDLQPPPAVVAAGRGRSDRQSDLRLVGDDVCRKPASGGTDRTFGRVSADLARCL